MYAFFFISGVTFKVKEGQSFGQFIVDNIKRLYIPYLFFAFAWDVTNIVMQFYLGAVSQLSPLDILKNIVSVLIGGGLFESNASIGPAWFLLALFVVRVICWFILKASHNKIWVLGAVSGVLFVIGYLLNGYDFLPFKIISTLTAFLFVFAGYCIKSVYQHIKDIKGYLSAFAGVIGLGIAFVMSVLADKALILVSNKLPTNPIFTLVGGFMGCFGVLLLSIAIESISIVSKPLVYCGINSLIIMGVHGEINFLFQLVLEELIGIPQSYSTVIIFVLTFVLVIPICAILNNYFPVLIGRRKSEK